MVTPKIGDIVYFTDSTVDAKSGETVFVPAIVVRVLSERLLDITIFDTGRTICGRKVLAVLDGDSIPKDTAYCQLERPPAA